MKTPYPSIDTDLLAAAIELADKQSLRKAAQVLSITEQALRYRLLCLEEKLGYEIYHKAHGRRTSSALTPLGEAFIPRAVEMIDLAREMLGQSLPVETIRIASTTYMILYVLIKAVKQFHQRFPNQRVQLSTHTEVEIERALIRNSSLDFGVAAPWESVSDLEYIHLFSLDWFLITPMKHHLADLPKVALGELASQPMIIFERGSTGRQHILDAFMDAGISPKIEMETSTTEIIVRMVEAGLGVAIVPLMPDGSVTQGRKVEVRPIKASIRPIRSGVLVRNKGELSAASLAFIQSLQQLYS